MTSRSVLLHQNPDGSTIRKCGCGQTYTLPIPYDHANPAIRDLCTACFSEEQWRRKEGVQ